MCMFTFLSAPPPVAFYGLFYLLEPLQNNVLSNFHDYVFKTDDIRKNKGNPDDDLIKQKRTKKRNTCLSVLGIFCD